MRHARAFRRPGISAIELCEFVSVRFTRGAVECRQFSDQLWNRHAQFGRSQPEHVRGVFVDLDTDVDTHGTRIADPETVSGGVWPTNVVRFLAPVVATATCELLKVREEMMVSREGIEPSTYAHHALLHRPQRGRGAGRDTDLVVDVLDVMIGGLG